MGGYYTEVKYDYGDLIIWFSKKDNKVFSVTTTSENVHTARGIRVGSSCSEMQKAYGDNCQISGDKMFSYYSYSSTESGIVYGLIFKVTFYRADPPYVSSISVNPII